MQCKECGEIVSRNNVTGLCRICRQRERSRKCRTKLKEEKRCRVCCKKVNPMIIYPNGIKGVKIIKFPTRCYKCRIKEANRLKEKKLKNGV